MAKALDEKDFAKVGAGTVSYRAEDVKASGEFRADYVSVRTWSPPNRCRSSSPPTATSSISFITR